MVFLIPGFILIFIILQLVWFEDSPRQALVQSLLVFALVTALSTEILSLLNGITYQGLVLIWGVLNVGLVGILVVLVISRRKALLKDAGWKVISDLNRTELFLGGAVLFFLLVTLAIALMAPPNNVDSMTYHMARVAHWAQNQNVRFYPTWVERQNHAMPLAEFVILHLQILSKSDRFANLVQWSAYLGSIVLSSLMAREFDLSRRFQLWAGFLVAVLPMAILQSTSTQNDLVVSFFILAFAYYLIRFGKTNSPLDHFLAGTALGAALLTKGTGYVYAAAVGIVFGAGQLLDRYQKDRSRAVLFGSRLALIVILALALNAGHYSRNINLYGHPLSTANHEVTTDRISLPIIASNMVRNGAVQIATPFQGLNQLIVSGVELVLGTRVGQPESTFLDYKFEVRFLLNEDYAGNFFHFILVLISIIFVLSIFRRSDKLTRRYALAFIGSVLIFSGLIKWQPWVSRLQLPLFILAVPIILVWLNATDWARHMRSFLIVILFIGGIPYLLFNQIRPIFPILESNPLKAFSMTRKVKEENRELYWKMSKVLDPLYGNQSLVLTDRDKLYFMADRDLYWSYQKAAGVIEDLAPGEVGLYLGDLAPWEYPIWVFTDQHFGQGQLEFSHIGMDNQTASLADNLKPWPSYIFSTSSEAEAVLSERGYQLIETSRKMQIFRLKK
jgi:4-amino-4-deoxy-L-arabinose transferase-like glycosyltransferase